MKNEIIKRAFNITYRQMYNGCMCLGELSVAHAEKCPLFREIWDINYKTINNFIRKGIIKTGYTSEADFIKKVD